MLLTADTVVTGREVLRPGWIEMSGDRLVGVGRGLPSGIADMALGAVTLVPGFVDTHVHGGGGFDFNTAYPDEVAAAVSRHRRCGTTTLVASLVSAGPAELLDRVRVLTDLVHEGLLAGLHLEGPWLAASRCGAHDPAILRDPSPAEVDRVLTLGGGAIRMVTLAPERTGSRDAIERIVGAGAVAAIGHTDASYWQTRAAIGAGATVATHLFNAMRPIHQREPGPIIALLEDASVTVELICDGVHIDSALYRHVLRSVGPKRISVVTDAMAASGMPDGRYLLGPLAVEVANGVARIADSNTIAGSTTTMDCSFRYVIEQCGLPRDEALLVAVQHTSVNPARALGLPCPVLEAGGPADLVALDASLNVTLVIAGGSRAV